MEYQKRKGWKYSWTHLWCPNACYCHEKWVSVRYKFRESYFNACYSWTWWNSIGDLTQFEIDSKSKEIIEHKAVHTILDGLIDGEKLEELFLEFDAKETKEAIFAYQCDKLECDLQSKLYDEEKCVDLNDQPNNEVINNKRVKELLNNGASFSEMWLKFGQETYPYD